MAIECYCADCQKLSGATRLPQLAVPRAQLVIAGPVNIYKTKADSGMDVECGSCCRCGSLIYKASSRFPDQIFLAVGCFDDLSRFEPGMKVYMDGQPEWDKT